MYCSRKYLIAGCISLILVSCDASSNAPPGFMEGHLKIFSPKEVELAGENTLAATSETYAEYPLIIVSRDRKKEIARVTANRNGNYRVELPPGDYVLDVQGRAPGHLRATPQLFTVVSNQIVRIDMDIDTGIR